MNKQEQITNLRSWIPPKEAQIHTIKQNIELQNLIIKHSKENVKNGWFIKEKQKKIKEARTDYEKRIAEFELKTIKTDIKNGFIGQLDLFKLEEFKKQLKVEEKTLTELKKKITMIERNHSIKK